ncbi:MAG: hypothetical protein IT435_11520 [Phycisphaerales bacterium]|nr:hypothetical protein [Phycisphaerales bacterium]
MNDPKPPPELNLSDIATEKVSDLLLSYLECLDNEPTFEQARKRFWSQHPPIEREYGVHAQRYLEERMADLEFCCGCMRLGKTDEAASQQAGC